MNRVCLVDCINNGDAEYLILHKDKHFGANMEKEIYIVGSRGNMKPETVLEPLLDYHSFQLETCPTGSNKIIFSPMLD
jgi:hypothetical protein